MAPARQAQIPPGFAVGMAIGAIAVAVAAVLLGASGVARGDTLMLVLAGVLLLGALCMGASAIAARRSGSPQGSQEPAD